jgi:hypothetical protein
VKYFTYRKATACWLKIVPKSSTLKMRNVPVLSFVMVATTPSGQAPLAKELALVQVPSPAPNDNGVQVGFPRLL